VPRRCVLHVCESTDGGVGAVVSGLVPFQVGRGWDVVVAAPSDGAVPSALERAGARFAAWEATPQPGPRVARELASLARIVKAADPGVVHLHSSKAGLVGRLLLRRRRPTVMQPHSWSFWAKTGAVARAALAWERVGARFADVVLCVSEDERRVGQESGIRARFEVLPNGIDLTRFPPPGPGDRDAARALLGTGGEPLAVCVGRLHRQKNQDALLDVWPRVRGAVPGARLVLVGDGPDRQALERRAVDGVELVGGSDDPRPWLSAADVVVAPSRWEAGMSLVTMEAMACGRSVVATDVAGMRSGLGAGAGAVVPQDDPAALAAAVIERLADPARADAEGAVGRARVQEHHDLRRQHEGIERLYERLLAERA
jgi:glycosyltransferase involved in cell wall biosynthesis